jgi:hypothetical protein
MEDRGRAAQLDAYAERFRAAGLPLFDEDFSASTDVFNRAFPLLALVFLGEFLGASKLEWSWAANAAALVGGLAILLGAAGLLNLVRGRPFRSMPEDIGRLELTAFVVVPSLLPLIFGGQVGSAALTAAANLLLLALIYAVLAYGLPSILRWVGRRLVHQFGASFMLLARAVPLLLIFALLAFVNTEMWQVFADVGEVGLVGIGLLFVGMGTAFLLARLPREVRELEREVGTEGAPLNARQRRNVALVMFVGQAVQVLSVAALVTLFFVVFGAIAIPEAVREAWIGEPGNQLLQVTVAGEQFQVTSVLLKVSAGLGAFSGLYFAVAMLTDGTYRAEFLDDVTGELRTVFRERADYLRLRGSAAA